jgi:hypothetical protein
MMGNLSRRWAKRSAVFFSQGIRHTCSRGRFRCVRDHSSLIDAIRLVPKLVAVMNG